MAVSCMKGRAFCLIADRTTETSAGEHWHPPCVAPWRQKQSCIMRARETCHWTLHSVRSMCDLPRKRTRLSRVVMSALFQKRIYHADHENEKERDRLATVSPTSMMNRLAITASSSEPSLRPCGSNRARGWD